MTKEPDYITFLFPKTSLYSAPLTNEMSKSGNNHVDARFAHLCLLAWSAEKLERTGVNFKLDLSDALTHL